MIDELKKKIASTDGVGFGPFGEGISDEWITKAEERLHFIFPESYKWWLKNYMGGEIYGEEIFSIYGLDFDRVVGGDIVYINELNREEGFSNSEQLVICEGEDGMFYFQKQESLTDELAVFRDGEYYASDFIEFLIKRIDG
ncbi:SMI1/KNR4 family protein [Streptococcus sp. DTU_2020_1001019_1_SI_AUS_MUR_006]|uniref:SMI1/KNR4 family protein n=1 Tax=Streptococcus sp. DTU_2020_1001019_1_SI_AUS_MUR_006 TaxID=3077584 RepID=UPI0028EAEE6F|nr:SMI1/KNR4 family protein [Streptococcus sp. DTU_2020_1001019_1_SI_AUS_MUR_006]WNS72043.1 SMI1/KNR4 family protein [Streptococcus sp. DTU_2020_1001019_1_SI_AUS_MUR_006]